MSRERVAAEVFAPGDLIREELEARGWTQAELSEILGRDTRLVSEIVSGKRSITPETARGLGEAFGTGAQFWLNMESAYQLHKVGQGDPSIARRARLYSFAPVKEMVKRNWIAATENVEVLEKQVCDFFEIKSLDQTPALAHAARKGTTYASGPTSAQLAWLYRAKKLARALSVGEFSDAALSKAMSNIHALMANAEDSRHLPKLLSEAGIRFVVIEALPNTRIDGACFWLDGKFPVIAISLRFDRIDWFWFTVLHELDHVKNRDGQKSGEALLDTDLVGEQAIESTTKPDYERRADESAAAFIIPPAEIGNFIARVRPLYSKEKIKGFAARLGIHPGLVVGQLQHLKEISFAHNREMLARVRNFVTPSALTDGWGSVVSVSL